MSTSANDFASAVYTTIATTVPADESTTIFVEVTEVTAVNVEVADSIDLNQPANVQELANDAATAACVGFSGSCTASVLGSSVTITNTARRRLAQDVAINVTLTYTYDQSAPTAPPDAGTQVSQNLPASYSASLTSSTRTALSASANVETSGAAGDSAVDDSLADTAALTRDRKSVV